MGVDRIGRVVARADDEDDDLADIVGKRRVGSDATAAKALGTTASPETIVKLLSEENLELLRLIVTRQPASVSELARLADRAVCNLSHTLKKLHEAGIVDFDRGPGRTRALRLTARRVTLVLDLGGASSVVSVERPESR